MPVMAPRGDDYADEPTRIRRGIRWLRHYSLPACLALNALLTAFIVSDFAVYRLPTALYFGVTALILPLYVFAELEATHHVLRWCDRCIWLRVAQSGGQAAQRARWKLHLFHLRNDHMWIWWMYWGAALVVLTYGSLAVRLAVCIAWMSVSMLVSVTTVCHGWHRSHCPWCRGDDGGADTEIVDPTPDPTRALPLDPRVRA